MVTTNQYKAETAGYLDLIVVEALALNNERTAINVLGQRMNAAVLLIEGLGEGWNASALPSADNLTIDDEKRRQVNMGTETKEKSDTAGR